MSRTNSFWKKWTSKSRPSPKKQNPLRKWNRFPLAFQWLEDRTAPSVYGQLPLSFEANRGQTDPTVDFFSRGSGYALFLSHGTAVLSLSDGTTPAPGGAAAPGSTTVLRMSLDGANPIPRVDGQDRQPGISNYLVGSDPSQWHTDVPNFGRVAYSDVYPGVDLVYYGNQRQLEYDFTVRPGAGASVVRLHFEGTDSLSLDGTGNLVLHTAAGDVTEQAPVLYQDVSGVRTSVAGNYVLIDSNHVGFRVGTYDRTKPLVIDPVLGYSTFLGGSGSDTGYGIAVDGSGNAYITGQTFSTNYPTTTGAKQTAIGGGGVDAFVSKLNATGTALVYSTYLGGNGAENAYGIAVDGSGNAYVTGYTSSSNFPTTAGVVQTTNAGSAHDVFVSKLNTTGTALSYSTYLGGTGGGTGHGIAVDSSGNAYVTGETSSSTFPVTSTAPQKTFGGSDNDAFVTKLNATGTTLAYSTYLGGVNSDVGYGIAVDGSGNAYVTGDTFSSNFKTTTGAKQTILGGASDAFVTKVNAGGTAFTYSTFLGGSSEEYGYGIAVNAAGNAYVTGATYSDHFPVTSNAPKQTYGGNGVADAYVAELNTTGTSLVYSTYLGGGGDDYGFGIALNSAGNAYVTGYTQSTNFPTAGGPLRSTLGGTQDGFMTKVDATGGSFTYSTYLGGSGSDTGYGIAVDGSNNAYVTGGTGSSDYPTSKGALRTTISGGDAFVTQIAKNTPTLTLTPGGTVLVGSGSKMTATVVFAGGYNAAGTLTFSLSHIVGGRPVVVDTETTSVAGNKSYSTPLGYLPVAGDVYTWVVSYNGDSENNSASGNSASEIANAIPAIATQPASLFINDGQTATFTSTATGYPAPTVQWMVSNDNGTSFTSLTNGSTYSGVTTTTLTVSNAGGSLNNNKYKAVFTNSVGSVAGTPAVLTVDTVTPVADATADVGQSATFAEISTGVSDTVQWQVSTDGGASFSPLANGGYYSGVTTPNLKVGSVTSSLNQNRYRAVVTNAAGSLTSNAATLTVGDVVTTQPADRTINAGQTVTFTTASGYASDSVQWYVSNNGGGSFTALTNGAVYGGVTTNTLTVTAAPASLTGTQYKAVFTPLPSTPYTASLTTNAAFLTVDSVKMQPDNQRYGVGQTVSFTAASALPDDAIQWKVSLDGGATFQALANGGPYSGMTTGQLTITGATAAMASNEYQAVFSNAAGSFATAPVALVPVTLWDTDPAPNAIAQGAAAGQPVGITLASDLNGGTGLTFRLTDDAGGRFAVDASTGVVRVAPGFATQPQTGGGYPITGEVRDSAGNTVTGSFTVNVARVAPGVPVDNDSTPNSVVEKAAAGTPVGLTALAAGPNPVTYALTDDAGGRFAIHPSTGVVTVANGNLLTYSSATSHTITVRADDGYGGTASHTFTIYVTSSAANAISVGGFALVNATVNAGSVAGDADLPLAGLVHLTGSVSNGHYTLVTAALSNVSVEGYLLTGARFTLTDSGLSLSGTATLPVLGPVSLSGSISSSDDFRLAVAAPLPNLGGFPPSAVTVTPGKGGIGLETQIGLPTLGTVTVTGVIQSNGSYNLTATLPTVTVNGVALSNAGLTLTNAGLTLSGDASVPLVGTVHLSGLYQGGQYGLTAGIANFTLAGVLLTGASVTVNSAGVRLSGTVNLPVVGSVALSGSLPDATSYTLTAPVPSLTLGGVSLTNTTVTLRKSGINLSGTANLPLVGNVTLSGTFLDAGHYHLTATVPHLTAGGASLDNFTTTLDNAGISLAGTATLPLVGSVPLSGYIFDAGHYSFSDHLPSVGLGGFSLTNVDVILSGDGLRLVADATLPAIGTVRHVQGTIQDGTHYQLTVPVPTVSVGQFSLSNGIVTLNNGGTGTTLGLAGDVTLPLFGTVNLSGLIDPSGGVSFTRTLPTFSLPGGAFKIQNTTLTLSPDRVHVETDVSVLGLAQAHFTGDVLPNGEYELDAAADLTIAGFTIPKPPSNVPDLKLHDDQLDIGFNYGLPGLDSFLPPGDGGVSFSGTYSLNGQWSLTATANYALTIGPVVVNSERITLTPNSLTLGAHGSIADLGPLAEGDVAMTIFRNGTFEATATVNSSIAGFSLGTATVTFGDHNDSHTLVATLHGVTTIPAGPNVTLDGYWDSNGKFDFRGTETVSFGPLTLANAQFALSNIQGPAALTFSAGVNFGVLQADVTGLFVTDGHGGFSTSSHAKGTAAGVIKLDLDGSFDSHGNFDFTGKQDVSVGPLVLSKAQFELNSTTGLTLSDSWNYLDLYKGTVSARVGTDAQGLVIVADADGNVLGSTVHLHGDVHASTFDLSGQAKLNVGPFSLATANFELSNVTGFTFGANWNYLGVFVGDVSGTIGCDGGNYLVSAHAAGSVFGQTTHLDGTIRPGSYDLRGDAKLKLGPVDLATANFRLSSEKGFTFSSGWNFLSLFSGSVGGTIGSDAQGYVVTTHADGTIFGQKLTLDGDIHPTRYDLKGSAKAGLGIFTVAQAGFELSNVTGFTFTGHWDYLGVLTGNLTGTIGNGVVSADAKVAVFGVDAELTGTIRNGGNTYSISGNADVALGPLQLAQAQFLLSSTAGFTFSSDWDFKVFSGSVHATIGTESQGYFVHVDATGRVLGQLLKADLIGDIHMDGRYDLKANADLTVAGVSLTSVGLELKSDGKVLPDFTFSAGWNYPFFSGTVTGSIGGDGRVRFGGNGNAKLAGFTLINLQADVDLDPAHGKFRVDLGPNTINVLVADVQFSAHTAWTSGSLPEFSMSGKAAVGGILSSILEGSVTFTIGTTVVEFQGTLGIPHVPGVSVAVDVTLDSSGILSGLQGINGIPGLADLKRLAAAAWHGLGVGFDDVAKGLNAALGVAGDEAVDLLKGAGATADELKGALQDAFNWSDDQLSNVLGSAGGVVSSAAENVGSVLTGKKHIHFGVPSGSLVFFDADLDGTWSPGEPWGFTTVVGDINFRVPTTFDTNQNGMLDDAEGRWVVEGGTDLTTGLAPVGRAVTPASWDAATPLTTLATVIADEYGTTLLDALGQVRTAAGLPPLDMTDFDPVAEILAGNPLGILVERVHARVEDTVAEVAALFRSPAGSGPSLALTDTIQSVLAGMFVQAGSPIDFADPSVLVSIIQTTETRTGIALDSTLVTKAAGVIAAGNQRLDAVPTAATLEYLAALAKIRIVTQGAVADDLAGAASGALNIDDVVALDTGASLSARIGAAQPRPYLVTPPEMIAAATSPAGAAVAFTVPAYDFAGQALTPTFDFPSGSTFPIGTSTVLVSTTDSLGTTRSASFQITVIPSTPPTLTLPANIVVEATTEGGAVVTLPTATAADPVDPAPQVVADHASGFFPLGTTTIWVTATDAFGNSTTGSYTVTVRDTTAPVLVLPPTLIVEANQSGGADVVLPPATSSDLADPAPLVTVDQASGFFSLGTSLVHVTATDAAGNVNAGTYLITVVDTTPPSISLPEDVVVEADRFGGTVVNLPTATVSDMADPSPQVTLDHTSGFFPIGTTVITVTATDASGNSSTNTYSVTVVDHTAPVLTLPSNIVVEADRQGGAGVTLPAATASDLADASPVVTADYSSGDFPLGTTVVNVTATDASGNVSYSTYTVLVVDTTAPTLTLPANLIVPANTRGGAVVALPTATATDTADTDPVVTYDHYSGFFPLGTTDVHVTARDASGNLVDGSFSVTVIGSTPPTLTVPSNLVVESTVPGGGAVVTLPDTTASSRVDPNPAVVYDHASGFFPLGTTVVRVTATDVAGNSSTDFFTVTVVDTTPPVASVPADLIVAANTPGGALVTLPAVTATDLVDPHPTVTLDHPSGYFPVGTTRVRITTADAAGNVRYDSFTVTVQGISTATTLTAGTPGPATYGDALSFTVVVTDALVSAVPDGDTVTLYDAANGNAVVGTGTVLAGTAVILVSKLNAGSHTLFASFAGDGDLAESQSDGVTQFVNRRALTIQAVTNTKDYDGTTDAAGLPVVTGLQSGDGIMGLKEVYDTSALGSGKTLVPSGTVMDGNGGENYDLTFINNLTGRIGKGTAVVTWADPADVTVGTPLSGIQLNATANVSGTFTYTPALGTILAVGSGQLLSVTFTPDDTADYSPTTVTVSIDVKEVNHAPTLNPVGSITLEAGAGFVSFPLTGITAGPQEESGQTVTVTAVSDRTDLISNPTVVYGDDGTATLLLNPAAAVGVVTITVTVKDDGGTDNGGMDEVQRSFTVTLRDTTPPITDGDLTGVSGDGGWYIGPVSVILTASDIATGVAHTYFRIDGGEWQAYLSEVNIAANGIHTVDYFSVDGAGNEEAVQSLGFRIDSQAPATTASAEGIRGDNDWYTSAVQLSLGGSDNASGVAGRYRSIDGGEFQAYTDAILIDSEGHHSVSYFSVDGAGNAEDVQVLAVNIDGTPPTLSAEATTADGAVYTPGVWTNQDVTVHFTTDDALSGTAQSPPDLTVTQNGGGQSVAGTGSDQAGNSSTLSFDDIRIDKSAPTTTTDEHGYSGDWVNHSVLVSLNAVDQDGLSGVRTTYYVVDSGPAMNYDGTAGIVVSAPGVHTVTYWSEDVAGNVEDASAGHTLTVQIDLDRPVTSADRTGQAYADSHAGWNNTDVIITLSPADSGGSSLARTEYSVDGGGHWTTYVNPVTLSEEGTYDIRSRSIDVAGNVEDVSTGYGFVVRIDKTAPAVIEYLNNPAGTGWYNIATGPAVYAFTASDLGAGLASPASGSHTFGDGANQNWMFVIGDVAGNSTTVQMTGINQDTVAPTPNLSPTSGTYLPGTKYSWSAADGLSGFESTAVSVDAVPYSSANTGSDYMGPGVHGVSVTTTDVAGNRTTVTQTYTTTGVGYVGGDLWIVGTSLGDVITVSQNGNTGLITVSLNGVATGPWAPTGRIVVHGLAGNDDVQVAAGVKTDAVLYGDDGNDTITGGGGNDLLDGGNGNDTLTARGGNDTLLGGDGDDSLQAGAGNDSLCGGAGNDILKGGSGNDSLFGGSGNDSLVGGSGTDLMFGEAGNDTLRSGSGMDTLFGGEGDDSLLGGAGNDYLDGGAGNDYLDGGGGDDILIGGLGFADSLNGGSGNDQLLDEDGVAIASGDAGNDQITLTFASDWNLNGSTTLLGDAIGGGAGDDVIDITTNNASMQLDLYGQGGNDHFTLHGVWLKIRVYGGAGTDVVVDQGTGAIELYNVEVGP